MYKQLTAWLLAVVLLLSIGSAALAEEAPRALVVANPTKLSGSFFTNRWGNNTSDIDVRTLLHGLGTVAYLGDDERLLNNTVVRRFTREVSPQGHVTYTLTLWDDLRFSDGSAMTARDYAGSVLLLASPQLHTISQGGGRSYEHILGFEDYFAQKTNTLTGLRLLDDTTLALTIDAAFLPFYFEHALVDVVPYPMAVLLPGMELVDTPEGLAFKEPLKTAALADTLFGEDGYVSHPQVTSGPYRLTTYDAQTGEAAFERNPYYKGDFRGQQPSIERLRLVEGQNQTMLRDLLNGDLGLLNKMTWSNAITRAKAQAGRGNIQVASYDRRGLAFISFTCDQGPTASLNVRRAVATLINRQRVVEDALRANGKPVYGYYGLGQEIAVNQQKELQALLHQYPTSRADAEALFAADGWQYNRDGEVMRSGTGQLRHRKQGDTLEPLTLRLAITGDNPVAESVAKHLESQLRLAGGHLEVIPLDANALFRQYYRQDDRAYDMLFLGSNFDMVFDPYPSFAFTPEGVGQGNLTGITNQQLMALADNMRHTPPGDREAYQLAWQRFQQRLVEQLPLLPLYSNTYYDAFTNDLENYRPQNHHSWAQAILYAKWKE